MARTRSAAHLAPYQFRPAAPIVVAAAPSRRRSTRRRTHKRRRSRSRSHAASRGFTLKRIAWLVAAIVAVDWATTKKFLPEIIGGQEGSVALAAYLVDADKYIPGVETVSLVLALKKAWEDYQEHASSDSWAHFEKG
jgi:hypothetical protein